MNDHRDSLPALSMFKVKDGWAVTVDDYYCPDKDIVRILVTFDTKEEAQAFILAEQRRQSPAGPL